MRQKERTNFQEGPSPVQRKYKVHIIEGRKTEYESEWSPLYLEEI